MPFKVFLSGKNVVTSRILLLSSIKSTRNANMKIYLGNDIATIFGDVELSETASGHYVYLNV